MMGVRPVKLLSIRLLWPLQWYLSMKLARIDSSLKKFNIQNKQNTIAHCQNLLRWTVKVPCLDVLTTVPRVKPLRIISSCGNARINLAIRVMPWHTTKIFVPCSLSNLNCQCGSLLCQIELSPLRNNRSNLAQDATDDATGCNRWAVAPWLRGGKLSHRAMSRHVAPQDAQLAKALQTAKKGHDPRLPDLGTIEDRIENE